jgi:hypothetical protein
VHGASTLASDYGAKLPLDSIESRHSQSEPKVSVIPAGGEFGCRPTNNVSIAGDPAGTLESPERSSIHASEI